MNAEVIKAMNKKKSKESKIKKWWHKNDYKVYRVIFFPAWFISLGLEKYNNWADSKVKWDEERTNDILNYYIPRRAEWEKDTNSFYFYDNGYGWYFSSAKKYLKRKDYRYWKINHYKIRDYLIESFNLDNFTKEVKDSFRGQTEINFVLNKKGLDKSQAL